MPVGLRTELSPAAKRNRGGAPVSGVLEGWGEVPGQAGMVPACSGGTCAEVASPHAEAAAARAVNRTSDTASRNERRNITAPFFTRLLAGPSFRRAHGIAGSLELHRALALCHDQYRQRRIRRDSGTRERTRESSDRAVSARLYSDTARMHSTNYGCREPGRSGPGTGQWGRPIMER